MNLNELIPSGWVHGLSDATIGLGLDVASTTNRKSNPWGLVLAQREGKTVCLRLVLRWKSARVETALDIIRHVLGAIPAERQSFVSFLNVDKSNEKLAFGILRRKLSSRLKVTGYAGNQKVRYGGEEGDAKTLMGSALIQHLEDGLIAMPECDWLEKDFRLVTRNGAKFDADVDANGGHADTFDAAKLALWGLVSGGAGARDMVAMRTSDFAVRGEGVTGGSGRLRLAQLRRGARRSAMGGQSFSTTN